jgi:hypothetical protein
LLVLLGCRDGGGFVFEEEICGFCLAANGRDFVFGEEICGFWMMKMVMALDGSFFALNFTPETVVASATVSGVLENWWFMVVWVLDLLI